MESLEEQIRARVSTLCALHESKERAELGRLLASDCTIVLGMGQVLDRCEYVVALSNFDTQRMRSGDLRLLHGDHSVAICTGTFDYKARRISEQSNYEEISLFHTLIWIQEDGEWRLLLMQGTRTPTRHGL